ncbi:Transcriptional regulator GlxA family, contains an amidase domain and an AraC-type DNA-binding HTH domain [Nocardia amikacinitolerans]|uniref:Transcriptional regulator GlxA family, contains an amidase domain and an AraC-type DNA-binding HTH domain n=1 Tax=Nocardia amikacinitolerans TaxID=756689 RepID=A0A285L9H4_9NOCA|nr:DJ-1/PfpI family protein [Nocardia amikacinitolerans]MCP2275337.1 Transcriptional regulator GlxA family, contains an amidase domain and an AraC-type DNA-binding HTH domain [Nocardia amikacinitolerans]SNY81123.1 Transcriptional regulator GlxA family, contains an amidase domain and an AraC-type DNA-binding HTH domain [Nocardia amikacinitolerans]
MSACQIAVVLYPGMTALDAIGPYEVLRFAPGAEVRFVGHEIGPVVTDSGALALGVTHTFDETPAPRLVVVPGGPAATAVAADERVLEWVRAVHTTAEWTTSVCTGALVLAAAGLLDGQPATTHWAAQRALGLLGAVPQRGERFVVGDRIATAAGVSAGIDLALWLVGEIFGEERAEAIQLAIEYDPRPPFDAGHPDKVAPAVRRSALIDQVRLLGDLRHSETLLRTLTGAQQALWRSAIRRTRS